MLLEHGCFIIYHRDQPWLIKIETGNPVQPQQSSNLPRHASESPWIAGFKAINSDALFANYKSHGHVFRV
jgi:hypothetical protein